MRVAQSICHGACLEKQIGNYKMRRRLEQERKINF
jgi:hypothetical protein